MYLLPQPLCGCVHEKQQQKKKRKNENANKHCPLLHDVCAQSMLERTGLNCMSFM